MRIHTPADATRLGIETVYQDLALCDNLDVVQNMFLGRERVASLVPRLVEPLSELEMEKRSLGVLESLRVTTIENVRTRVAALSGGQRQSVAISRAVMWNSRLVILDEPTAALGVAQTEQVLALIRRLREQRLGVVVISAQPPRGVRDRRPHRRAAARPAGGDVRARDDDAGGGRCDLGGESQRRPGGGGRDGRRPGSARRRCRKHRHAAAA